MLQRDESLKLKGLHIFAFSTVCFFPAVAKENINSLRVSFRDLRQ